MLVCLYNNGLVIVTASSAETHAYAYGTYSCTTDVKAIVAGASGSSSQRLNTTHILRLWMLLYGTLHSSAVSIGDDGNRLVMIGTVHDWTSQLNLACSGCTTVVVETCFSSSYAIGIALASSTCTGCKICIL